MNRTKIPYNEFDITKLSWELPERKTDKNGMNPHHIAEPLYNGKKGVMIELPVWKTGGIKWVIKDNKMTPKMTFVIDHSNPEHIIVREILKGMYDSFIAACSVPEFYGALDRTRPITHENAADLEFRPPVFHPVEKSDVGRVTKVFTDKEMFTTKLINVPEKNFFTRFDYRHPTDPKKTVTVPWSYLTPTDKYKIHVDVIPVLNINRFMLTATSRALQLTLWSAIIENIAEGDFETIQKDTASLQSDEKAALIAASLENLKLIMEDAGSGSPLDKPDTKDASTFSPPEVKHLPTGMAPQFTQVPASQAAQSPASFVPPATAPASPENVVTTPPMLHGDALPPLMQKLQPEPTTFSPPFHASPGLGPTMHTIIPQTEHAAGQLASISAGAQRPTGLGMLPIMQMASGETISQ
jgi:hypothetical protein